jgi:phage recombination protein Bet
MSNNELVVAQKKQAELSVDIIKKYICPKATDQEAYTFMQLCNIQGLNPFLKEAYLVKYGDEAATIITGKDTFTKRADRLPQYDGFKAGIIVTDNSNQATYREGSFSVAGEKLLGGWAEVFRKDRAQSFRNEVSLAEYERRKKDGSLMSNWRTMPATMIRKVALVQSLREAFPDEFGGMYSPEEMPVDASALPVYEAGRPPVIVNPEAGNGNARQAVAEPQKKTEIKNPDEPASEPQKKAIHAILAKAGIKDVYEKHSKISEIIGVPDNGIIESFDVLTKGQASKCIEVLSQEQAA